MPENIVRRSDFISIAVRIYDEMAGSVVRSSVQSVQDAVYRSFSGSGMVDYHELLCVYPLGSLRRAWECFFEWEFC